MTNRVLKGLVEGWSEDEARKVICHLKNVSSRLCHDKTTLTPCIGDETTYTVKAVFETTPDHLVPTTDSDKEAHKKSNLYYAEHYGPSDEKYNVDKLPDYTEKMEVDVL